MVGLLRVLVFPNLIDYDIGETTVKTTASVLTGFTCCLLKPGQSQQLVIRLWWSHDNKQTQSGS